MNNYVYIKNYQRKYKIDRDRISGVVLKIFEILGVRNSSVTFVYVTPERMEKFNVDFRKISGPTDVLSFLDGDVEDGIKYLGDVIISPHIVKKNSILFNNSDFEDEFLTVHIHGILHLLGYTHSTFENREKMFSLQKSLKEKIYYFLGREK